MSNAINVHLVRVIADLALFLEFTNEELLDSDTSVGAMERMAAELRLMDDGDRRSLSDQLKSLSSKYEAERQAQFVKTLPESLGLE
ncbi:hypothetical protein J2S30_004177 [Herbaspirillum rubrisubalbicans]|jgi:hypothetical protein|uniref:hypothetical protein n=1 Tax=Herbaspirillum rubrisubalbicans TaxID=80842 RepID=UPI00209F2E91|nr:hypothetical protein [Herbaspirillum rubrisubalbicans]MCP1575798.1 hypothetical protein [Herbaspirillum rubrisubalbicans]